jgi:hypothetical protein
MIPGVEASGGESRDVPGASEEPTAPARATRPRAPDVIRTLADARAEAADLYVGGVSLLADVGNPARIRLSACAMREVIEELERAVG